MNWTDVVAGLIADTGGRLLACQRAPGRHLGGKWEFPGGKIEPGETPAAALARELKEELAIQIEVTRALTPVVHDYGSHQIRLSPFLCRVRHGVPQALEHTEVRWCDSAQLQALDWAEADLPILAEFLEGLAPFHFRTPAPGEG